MAVTIIDLSRGGDLPVAFHRTDLADFYEGTTWSLPYPIYLGADTLTANGVEWQPLNTTGITVKGAAYSRPHGDKLTDISCFLESDGLLRGSASAIMTAGLAGPSGLPRAAVLEVTVSDGTTVVTVISTPITIQQAGAAA